MNDDHIYDKNTWIIKQSQLFFFFKWWFMVINGDLEKSIWLEEKTARRATSPARSPPFCAAEVERNIRRQVLHAAGNQKS